MTKKRVPIVFSLPSTNSNSLGSSSGSSSGSSCSSSSEASSLTDESTMSTRSKRERLKFTLIPQNGCKGDLGDYHLTSKELLMKRRESKSKILEEIRMRDDFTRKNYGGRYDHRHKKFMTLLGSNLSLDEKLTLPLSAYSAIK